MHRRSANYYRRLSTVYRSRAAHLLVSKFSHWPHFRVNINRSNGDALLVQNFWIKLYYEGDMEDGQPEMKSRRRLLSTEDEEL